MTVEIYRKIVKGKELKNFIELPDDYLDKEMEVIIKPVVKKIFNSLSVIKINTEEFRFNRDEANER
jgi:hypothetical protein